MFYVYVLQDQSSKEIYVGSTNNLEKRFKQHTNGKVNSTSKYEGLKLMYYEAYLKESYARMREKKLKQHGNAKRELFKRAGITKNGAG